MHILCGASNIIIYDFCSSSVAYQRNCVLHVIVLHFRLRRVSSKTIDRLWQDRWNETSYCRRCQFLNCFCTCLYRNWIIFTRSLYIISLIPSSRDEESRWVSVYDHHTAHNIVCVETHNVSNKNESGTKMRFFALSFFDKNLLAQSNFKKSNAKCAFDGAFEIDFV